MAAIQLSHSAPSQLAASVNNPNTTLPHGFCPGFIHLRQAWKLKSLFKGNGVGTVIGARQSVATFLARSTFWMVFNSLPFCVRRILPGCFHLPLGWVTWETGSICHRRECNSSPVSTSQCHAAGDRSLFNHATANYSDQVVNVSSDFAGRGRSWGSWVVKQEMSFSIPSWRQKYIFSQRQTCSA